MKTLRMLFIVNLLWPFNVQAEIIRVTLTKVSADLYETTDGLYIETENCFADAKGTEAVLNFVRYACTNTLRFSEETICEVANVSE